MHLNNRNFKFLRENILKINVIDDNFIFYNHKFLKSENNSRLSQFIVLFERIDHDLIILHKMFLLFVINFVIIECFILCFIDKYKERKKIAAHY